MGAVTKSMYLKKYEIVLAIVILYFGFVVSSDDTGNMACKRTLGNKINGAVIVVARLKMPVAEEDLIAFRIINLPEKKTYDKIVDTKAGNAYLINTPFELRLGLLIFIPTSPRPIIDVTKYKDRNPNNGPMYPKPKIIKANPISNLLS